MKINIYLKKKFFLAFLLLPCFSFSQKTGLVLSGGGASGLAHIGVIKALEENNIPIDYVAGTSMGALIGALYAMGYSPAQMEALVESDEFYKWANGIIDDKHSYYFKKKDDDASWAEIEIKDFDWKNVLPTNIINPVVGDFSIMALTAKASAKINYNFDSLLVPFRCIASDVDKKQQIVFRNGDLGEAVRASMAFPFYFPPVMYKGKMLFDGGLYNNFPVDILQKDFAPDIIIGVNVAEKIHSLPDDDNLVSQMRALIIRRIDTTLKTDVMIEPDVNTDLFNFENIHGIIDSGYKAAAAKIQEVKKYIVPRSDYAEDLNKRREIIFTIQPEISVNEVEVTGVSHQQAEYVKNIILPDRSPCDFKKLQTRYFNLTADNNIKKIFPKLVYNKTTGHYKLLLDIKRRKNVIAGFGGNFSSRSINQGFVSAKYNIWRKQSFGISAGAYFGKLYSSGQIKIRMDVPGKFSFYIEPEATVNAWDFFKSSSTFFEDVKPSYLVKYDQNYALNVGIPARKKGKFVAGSALVRITENYYQTKEFSKTDTADRTNFNAHTFFINFERNTLNRKMYASSGTYLNLKIRYVYDGNEYSIPGSTAVNKTASFSQHKWWQCKFVWDDYFKRRGYLRFGFYSEVALSNQPFFNNYAASILAAPAFLPLQEMKTLFLENFYTHNYAGIGLKSIISPGTGKIEIRLEGYAFQPYREILKTQNLAAQYGEPFSKRYFIATAAAVYNGPLGPASLSINYYHDKQEPFSILMHFGYIIFNKKALD